MHGVRKITAKDKREMHKLYNNKKGLTMDEIAKRKGISIRSVHSAIRDIERTLAVIDK